MLNVDWQVKRWRETGDEAKIQAYHRHVAAGHHPYDALAAAALGRDPRHRPPVSRREVQIGEGVIWVSTLCWVVAAMAALFVAVSVL